MEDAMDQIKGAQAVWEQVKKELREEIDKTSFETWVENTQGIHLHA